ncbi:DgyrCDS12536 [Dimorphilus gyrociliatus]|uniref:DgyrCDS12536 n=1 Tax=Dimorphilus gyrociliatus TaxID=2664684 RepID=A0A7I8W7K4_9ANNE|nr:DgyrCDS12536 [Dimorphilus gyrociliatus]
MYQHQQQQQQKQQQQQQSPLLGDRLLLIDFLEQRLILLIILRMKNRTAPSVTRVEDNKTPQQPKQQQPNQQPQKQQPIAQTRSMQNVRKTSEELEDEKVRKNTMMNVKMSAKRKKIEEINQMHRSNSGENLLAKSLMSMSNLLQNQMSIQQQASQMNFMGMPGMMPQYPNPSFSHFGVSQLDPHLLQLQLLLGSQGGGLVNMPGTSMMQLPIVQKPPEKGNQEQPARKKSILKTNRIEVEDDRSSKLKSNLKDRKRGAKIAADPQIDSSADEDSEQRQNSNSDKESV